MILAAVAIFAFGLIAVVHEATRDAIAASKRARLLAKFDEVLAGERYDNDLLSDRIDARDGDLLGTLEPVPVYRARRHGATIAIVIAPVAPQGYSGPIRLLVGIRQDGRLLGVRVSEHRETPGLGDAIEVRKSNWILAFTGRSLQDPSSERWAVRKDGGDFDQFTGATITPRAVVGAVTNALVYFQRHRDELLDRAGTIDAMTPADILRAGFRDQNPGLVQFLGLCPLLAVSTSLATGLGLGLATLLVLTASNVAASLVGRVLPAEIRIAVFVVLIAALVTAVELVLAAWLTAPARGARHLPAVDRHQLPAARPRRSVRLAAEPAARGARWVRHGRWLPAGPGVIGYAARTAWARHAGGRSVDDVRASGRWLYRARLCRESRPAARIAAARRVHPAWPDGGRA